jgi:transcriptional regulator with XRE-family HTH domain
MNTPPHLNPTVDPIDAAVGAKIAEALEQNSISINALSKATGISRAQIKRYTEGSSSLNLPKLARIAAAIGTQPEHLISGIQAA